MTSRPGPPRRPPQRPSGFFGYVRDKAPLWGAVVLLVVVATMIFLISPAPVGP